MDRWGLPIAIAFICTAAGTASTRAAQSTSPTASTTPAANAAQNSSANSSSQQTPEKKVWTNDELSSLDPHAGVSTVGKNTNNKAKLVVSSKGHDAKWYHDQIVLLQAKIAPLDSQIAELQAGLDGKPTGDGTKSVRPYSVKADDWSRELAELQKKREDTLAQIGALQDQARHNGIAPNALP
jgi:hypothetical protein